MLDMSFADVDRITKLVPNVLNISLEDAIKAEPGFDELARKGSARGRSPGGRAAPRRPGAQLLRACGRRRHLARAAEKPGPALPHQPRRNCHPVRHERPGEAVAAQDGFPRPDHADPHRRRAQAHREAAWREAGARRSAARRSRQLTKSSRKGFTSGVFQFESPGMRDILRRYQPTRIEDLTALNALYRPGPHAGRHARRLHRAQARPQGRRLRSARAEADPRRNLRRHPVSGAGDADLQPPRRLLARRSRPAAPRHGQEEGRRDGRAARALRQGRARSAASRRRRSRRSST